MIRHRTDCKGQGWTVPYFVWNIMKYKNFDREYAFVIKIGLIFETVYDNIKSIILF